MSVQEHYTEPDTPGRFQNYVARRFAQEGPTESAVWFARGLGYGVGLRVETVDYAIINEAGKLGFTITDQMLQEQLEGAGR